MGSVGPVFSTAAPDQSCFYNDVVSLGNLRLLRKLKGIDDGTPLRFALKTFEIHNCPPFAAVSYCWGAPYDSSLSNKHGDTEQLSFSEHIELDGRQFAMTPNALAALKHAAGVLTLEYLWMDALCINQTSLAERADQVTQMDKVFERADYVIAWLGPSHPKFPGLAFMVDEFTPFVSFLRKIMDDELLMGQPPEGLVIEDGFDLKKYRKSQRDAEAFCKDCRWFFRTWIPQECILAREIHLYCGNERLDTQCLTELYDMFHLTRWRSYCSPYLAQFGQWLKLKQVFHDSKIWLQGPGPNYMDGFRVRECESGLWTLMQIVSKLRTTTCSDPRDKLFAAIPMASRYFTNDIQRFLKADYSLTPRDVYTSFSRMMIEETKSLSVLASVGDKSNCKIQDLPSWVSDHSSTSPIFLRYHSSLGQRECRIQTDGLAKEIKFTSDTLSAYGACFATVAKCAKGDDKSKLPSGFTVMEFLKSMPKYIGEANEPRTEACWRTLMSDISLVKDYKKAKRSVKQLIVEQPEPWELFCAWLNVELVNFIKDLLKRPTNEKTTARLIISLLASFEQEQNADLVPSVAAVMGPFLCEGQPRPAAPRPPFPQNPWVDHTGRDASEIMRDIASQYAATLQPPPLATFSDPAHSALARRHDEFENTMQLTMSGRECLFRTKEDFLGVGPYSLKPGDQIWFVQSSAEPLAFRPCEEPDTFTLLGGCYLHRFMGDEIFDPKWRLQEKWRRFTLV